MSIATDEAEEKYPRDVAMTSQFENNICRRTGYVAGRTADPTEAEIDAALPELIEAYRQESQLVTDRDYVARILLAARKAVTR